ncbi:hypothetical protein J6590_082363, partial [Homalodisca vitripennis]
PIYRNCWFIIQCSFSYPVSLGSRASRLQCRVCSFTTYTTRCDNVQPHSEPAWVPSDRQSPYGGRAITQQGVEPLNDMIHLS